MITCIRKLKSKRGFSLIEMVVVMGIVSITILASFSSISIKQKILKRGETVAAVQQEAVIAMKRIKRKVRETTASEVNIMSSKTLWPGDTAGGDVLVLASARDSHNKFRIDSTGAPEWQKVIVYYVDAESNSLREYTGPWSDSFEVASVLASGKGSPIIHKLAPVENGIAPVNFRWDYYSPELLHATVTTGAEENMGGRMSAELTTSIGLRN